MIVPAPNNIYSCLVWYVICCNGKYGITCDMVLCARCIGSDIVYHPRVLCDWCGDSGVGVECMECYVLFTMIQHGVKGMACCNVCVCTVWHIMMQWAWSTWYTDGVF
jgi:hypothetical protein